jgi:hypothetical protein
MEKQIRTVASAETRLSAAPAEEPTPARTMTLEIQELEARQAPTMIWGERPLG